MISCSARGKGRAGDHCSEGQEQTLQRAPAGPEEAIDMYTGGGMAGSWGTVSELSGWGVLPLAGNPKAGVGPPGPYELVQPQEGVRESPGLASLPFGQRGLGASDSSVLLPSPGSGRAESKGQGALCSEANSSL